MKFDGLNPPQEAAVKTTRGPLLVLAGAGTGKTRVVTFRIANLIRHGTRPDRILAVTFTNKAAAEMKERVGGLLGKKMQVKPVVCTFHAHCVQVLKRQIKRLGYPERFSICDRSDQEAIARSVLRELRLSTQALKPNDLLYLIGDWKSHSKSPTDAAAEARTDKEHLAAAGYRRYQDALRNRGAVDFDDLLLRTVDVFRQHPDALQAEASRFDHLLVDEYQDTNGSQYQIVRALAGAHRNLCVVGDDDQSIYGWRGAEVEHILRFKDDWPEAKVIRLEQNYRSTAEILEMANRLIAWNQTRHPKSLKANRGGGQRPRVEQYRNETEEAKSVVRDLRLQMSRPEWEARDFAILFRTNEQPRAFETELRQAQVPYVLIGGKSFFDRKEIRDVLAYLKVIVSPDDEPSLLRIINTPPRGLGKKAIDRLLEQAVNQGTSVWQQLCGRRGLQGAAAVGARNLTELIERFQSAAKREPLPRMLKRLLETIDYEGEIRRAYPDVNDQEARWTSVGEIVNALANYCEENRQADLGEFLTSLALEGRESDRDKEKQLERNAVALMTLHSAKGLEFPHVYLVGMEEGLLPHQRSVQADGSAIDEERRLCYVGVTRAQERLTLTMARTRMKWGSPRETVPSRFLYELTGMERPPAAKPKPKRPRRPPSRPASKGKR